MTDTNDTLPGLDDFQQRTFNGLTRRHAEQATSAAQRIQEYIGYVLRDLERGRLSSHYARSVRDDAQELVTRLAILEEGVDAVAGILRSAEPLVTTHDGRPIDARRNTPKGE